MSARLTSDEFAVLWRASCIVGLEDLRVEAFARLDDEALRALPWIGLTDDGWTALFEELARRGVTL